MRTAKTQTEAFTLIEMLVAVTITILIVVMLGTIFGAVTNGSLRANQRIDSFRDARSALNTIRRDITNLVRATSTTYFALSDQYSDPNTFSVKNRQVYGLTAVPPSTFTGAISSGLGDLCAVGYYCRWDSTKHCYTLCRYFSGSTATTATLKANGPGVSLATLYAPATSDEIMAVYIWNLQITIYKADGTIDTTYPAAVGGSNTGQLPAAIEISFDAISPEAAQTMLSVSSAPNDWMDSTTTNYKRLLLPHMYEFRTRINF